MRGKVIPLFFLLFSSYTQAKPFMVKPQASLNAEGPLKCVQMQGNWEGECRSSEGSGPAKVQVFQDYCTEIAFYDPSYPIPLSYKTSPESHSMGGIYGNSFGNSTKYSEWSKDGKSFQNKSFITSSFTIQGRTTFTESEDLINATLIEEKLEIKYSFKTIITTPEGQSKQVGQSKCTYSKTN